MIRSPGFVLVAGLLALTAAPSGAAAQPASTCEAGWLASPPVRSEAWTAGAARWLADRGELAGWPLPQGELPVAVAGCLFERARKMAPLQPATRWQARLAAEAGDIASPAPAGSALGARGGLGLAGVRGGAAPGTGLVGPEATGAEIAPSSRGIAAGGWLAVRQSRVYAHAHPDLAPGSGAGLRAADLGAQVGPFALALGRGRVAYGAGGLVFSGAAALDRAEVTVIRPVELPGWLGVLGPVTGHTFLAMLPEGRHTEQTWLWGGSMTVQPSPRLEIGLHRGMMLGGARESREAPMTAANVMHAFLGRHNNFRGEYVGDLRNQILSADVSYRVPLHPAWPVTTYLEWGTEDSAGGLRDVPGIVAGARTSPLLGGAALTLGIEQVYMGEGQRRGNPPWYRHGVFSGGWVADDVPLGHSLGGHGREWAAYLWADTPASVQIEIRAMTRRRGALNLFVPGWEGRSTATDLATSWSLRPGLDLVGRTSWESGGDWRRWEVQAGMEGSLR